MKINLFRKNKKKETKLEIHRIIAFTPCERHAWVETNKGKVRKEIKNIPAYLLK